MKPLIFGFESMGTSWEVTIWGPLSPSALSHIKTVVIHYCNSFDTLYSRFIENSFVCELSQKTGVQTVPQDFVYMLQLYDKLYKLSRGKCTPLVADTLSDLGYGMDYLLKALPQDKVRKVPALPNVLRIIDNTHIELSKKVTIDIGAVGKGYVVDAVAAILEESGVHVYLVNGSGDIRYKGDTAIKVGLEHPLEANKVVGVVNFTSGAMCSSAGNRRAWGGIHHIIDPDTHKSPEDIIATWVVADTAALADGLATALFLVPPEHFNKDFVFEYLLLNKNFEVIRSKGFHAELY